MNKREPRRVDIAEVERLKRAGFVIDSLNMQFESLDADDGTVRLTMRKGRTELNLISNDPAVVRLGWAVHPVKGPDGRWHQARRQSNSKYWQALEQFTRNPDEQRAASIDRVRQGHFKPDYVPSRLVSAFLRANAESRHAEEFLPLKNAQFDIWAYLLLEAAEMVERRAQVVLSNPRADAYSLALDRLLNQAFAARASDVWTQAYETFLREIRIDLHDAARVAQYQLGIVSDLLSMVHARRPNGITPRDIPHLLDAYRREVEALGPFLKALWEAFRMVQPTPMPPNASYWTLVEALRSTEHGVLVDCVEPAIRHSESHAATLLDGPNSRIVLTEVEESGKRVQVREYAFDEFLDLGSALHEGLLSALVAGICAYDAVMLCLVTTTAEYQRLVLDIDNPIER